MAIQIDEDNWLGCGGFLEACDCGAKELAEGHKFWETAASSDTDCRSCESCVDMRANSALS